MKRTSLFPVLAMAASIAFLGAGCSKPKVPDGAPAQNGPAGPQAALFENLSPADAAKRINLTNGSVVVMDQKFTGSGVKYAHDMGMGPNVQRTVTLRRFAPGNLTELEWKVTTDFTNDKGVVEKRQITGSVLGISLQSVRDLFLPLFWTEEERVAGGLSGMWLSSDVYENLAKSKISTFSPGIIKHESYESAKKFPKNLVAAIQSLEREAKKVPGNKDIYLATAEKDLSTYDLKVNEKPIKVEVIKASSWFGDYVILNNPQNPLVLEYVPSAVVNAAKLDGAVGYKITDIREIQQ